MNFRGVFVIGIGLSMDAFAVSVCKGLGMGKIKIWQMIIIAFAFAFFQFAMPVVGFFLCVQFESYIVSFDHWIAFGLLAFLGTKMIVEALKEGKEESKDNKEKNPLEKVEENQKLNFKELLVLAVATSIDALAVGITFAFFDFNIWGAGAIIGVTTFVLCCGGVLIGNFFGSKFKKPAEITGGVILILMGLKILLEHLGVLMF